ncbi:hypothetical protein Fcan01_25702 [Folsomia candida]|uniref:Uncharacterized protein n=1 Tax=Folsomia candida TaxID=158441 RepID=A0A226D3D2_FOLCA|nr:hypothetical protein Fcan01_25702 [Folsomia candida]
MVVTPLMWRSLDRFTSLFGFMVTNPIEYDTKKRRFQFNRVSMKMWPYICSVAIVFLSIFMPCLVLGIFKLFGLLQIPLANVMVVLTLTLISGVCFVTELISSKIGYKLLGLINSTIEWDKNLENSAPKGTDIMGHALLTAATTLGFYPYIITGFLLHAELDPLFQFQQLLAQYWTPMADFPISKFIVMSLLRPFLTLIAFFQICRVFTILLCGGAVGCVSLLDNIKHMERISYRFWIRSYAREILRYHAMIQILLQWSSDMMHSLVAIFQMSGFISVPFNYMTLKVYNIMPFRTYFALPVVCIVLPMSHQMLLPILISV